MPRRTTLALALICLLGIGGAAFHFFWFGYGQCHPKRTPATALETERARTGLTGLTVVSVTAHDGAVMRGWFAPPRNGVAIVLVHGLWGNRASLLPEAELFARHGYGVLLLDSRAHGESGGEAATWGSSEALDIADSVRFVRAQPQVAHVVLLGFSVGASAVARATANDPTISAVVLYATWPSLREEIAYKEPKGGWLGVRFALEGFRYSGTNVDDICPEADLARISPRPLLMVCGGQDHDTPPAIMDRMYAKATGAKEFWRQPEVGHGGYFQANPLEYERRVVGFLDRALGL